MDGQKEFLGHPKGLVILFLTEMWERFSYYGIRAILVLYMVAAVSNGGLGWDKDRALLVLGVFQMFCYLLAIPGGILSDKWLGPRKSVWIGSTCIMIGNFLLVLPWLAPFYAGLALIALGGGCLKPNISTILGRLYKEGDPRQQSAFSIFYLGVNVGAFISPLIVGVLANLYGWRYGFLASSIGMLFGQGVYLYGQKYIVETDAVAKQVAEDKQPLLPLTAEEKHRLGIIFFSFVTVVFFWAAFEQSGGLLNLYADQYTDRVLGSFTVPSPWFQSLNPLYIILLSPLAAMLWPYLSRKGKNPHAIVKMGLGTIIQGLGFLFMVGAVLQRNASATGQCSMLWLVMVYLTCTIGELALSPVAHAYIIETAPKRMTSLVMGSYMAMIGLASWLASRIGVLSTTCGELTVFVILIVVTTFLGILQLVFSRRLIRAKKN